MAFVLKSIIRYALLVLYHITFGMYVRIAYNLKLSKESDPFPKGPFVLLGNHCNNFDGLFLQCLLIAPDSLRHYGHHVQAPRAGGAAFVCRLHPQAQIHK